MNSMNLLADQFKTRGCSIDTSVINSFIICDSIGHFCFSIDFFSCFYDCQLCFTYCLSKHSTMQLICVIAPLVITYLLPKPSKASISKHCTMYLITCLLHMQLILTRQNSHNQACQDTKLSNYCTCLLCTLTTHK